MEMVGCEYGQWEYSTRTTVFTQQQSSCHNRCQWIHSSMLINTHNKLKWTRNTNTQIGDSGWQNRLAWPGKLLCGKYFQNWRYGVFVCLFQRVVQNRLTTLRLYACLDSPFSRLLALVRIYLGSYIFMLASLTDCLLACLPGKWTFFHKPKSSKEDLRAACSLVFKRIFNFSLALETVVVFNSAISNCFIIQSCQNKPRSLSKAYSTAVKLTTLLVGQPGPAVFKRAKM